MKKTDVDSLRAFTDEFAHLWDDETVTLLMRVADRLEKAEELIDDVRCSGIEHTNPGRYHVVQICVATWDEVNEFCGDR